MMTYCNPSRIVQEAKILMSRFRKITSVPDSYVVVGIDDNTEALRSEIVPEALFPVYGQHCEV